MNVKNPYISVQVGENQFSPLREAIRKELTNLGISFSDLPNPHISVAYLLGNKSLAELDSLIDDLSKDSFKLFVNGIRLLESSFYGGYIICLSLEHTDDFIYSQEFVKECLCNEEVLLKEDFPNGFQAHISLFFIKDSELNAEFDLFEMLPLYLETAISNIRREINGEVFTIFNDNREKILEKKIL